ncbi:MAG: hypothetical protein IKK87_10960 [Bacteroidaceae bacterium]|nr:hypothetical protein [Bacteroidaceae bacterium]
MPQISTILQDEQQNVGDRIRLYAEGIFYKAYERSAWVACRVLHPFMVKKRAVRKVGQEARHGGYTAFGTSLVKAHAVASDAFTPRRPPLTSIRVYDPQ